MPAVIPFPNNPSAITEAKFLAVVNHIPEGVIILNAANEADYISPAALKQFGYGNTIDSAMPGINLLTKMHPDDAAHFSANLAAAAASGKSTFSFIAHVLGENGQYILIEKNVYLRYAADEKYCGSVVICNDLSAIYRMEQSSLIAVSQLNKIASLVPGVIYQWRQKPGGYNSMPYASYALLQIFGVSPVEVQDDAEKIYNAIYPADLEEFKNSMLASARSMSTWQHEYRCVLPNGNVRSLYSNAAPEKEAGGSILWNGFITDITEKKHAELALKESEARFKGMFNRHGAVMLLINPDTGQIADANEAAEIFYGHSNQHLCAMALGDISVLPASELFIIMAEVKQGLKKRYHFQHRLGNGSIRTVDVAASLINYEGGHVLFAIITDITDKERQELHLKQQSVAMELSNHNLEIFTAVASHDLKEPLRMVSSFLHALEKRLDGKLDEKSIQYLNFAADGAERMLVLINDLLQYSKVNADQELLTVDTEEVLKYVKLVLSKNFEEQPTIQIMGRMPFIKCNKTLITQVFMNLIKNAVKYKNYQPAEIKVGFIEEPDNFTFYVSDNGIGIHKDYYESVFHLFKRLHSSSEYQGTGIGLALCKRIIDIHHGKIWVDSVVGKGSIFYFSIPKILI